MNNPKINSHQQLTQNIKEQVTKELKVEFEQRYKLVEPVDVIHARGRAITKGSCDVEDLEEDDIESPYQCRLLFQGNPPRVVAIEIVSRRFNHAHCVHIG